MTAQLSSSSSKTTLSLLKSYFPLAKTYLELPGSAPVTAGIIVSNSVSVPLRQVVLLWRVNHDCPLLSSLLYQNE